MLGPTSEPPSLSGGSCYICCPPSRHPPHPTLPISPPLCASMLCFVAPQLAALLAPTNLFLTLITARQQAAVQWAGQMKGSNLPITGGLLSPPPLFSWAPSVTGQQWIFVFFFSSFFLFPPQHWVKGGFFKGRRTRRVRSQGGARCSPGKGRVFFSSISRVEGSRGGGSPRGLDEPCITGEVIHPRRGQSSRLRSRAGC